MSPALAPGARFADVLVETAAGSLPGAEVYEGTQPDLGRRVRVYLTAAPADLPATERVRAAATRLAAVDDPHLLPVLGVHPVEGRLAVVTAPWGVPLETAARDGLTDRDAAGILEAAAAAMATLERHGIHDAHPTPSSVFVEQRGDGAVARVDAVAALLAGPATAPSDVAALAAVLRAAIGSRSALTGVAESAQQNGFRAAEELMASVRASVPPPARRSRLRLLAGLAAAAAVLVIAAVVLTRNGDDADRARSAGKATAARVVARIDVGGVPLSVSYGGDSLWVARQDRRLVRIDPRRNAVVGRPVVFGPPSNSFTAVVRADDKAVWTVDGPSGLIQRFTLPDLRPGTPRLLKREIAGAVLAGAELWVLADSPRGTELLRFDKRTLKPVGRPTPAGAQPLDIEPDGRAALVADTLQGNVSRIDTKAADVVVSARPSASAVDLALLDRRLWVPGVNDKQVVRLDATSLHVTGEAINDVDFPFTATAAGDTVWVVGATKPDRRAPARLHRVDARSARVLGDALPLGQVSGFPAGGAGDLWVPSAAGDVLRIRAASPPPAPRSRPRSPASDPAPLPIGLLRRGRYLADVSGLRLLVSVDRAETVSHSAPGGFSIGWVDEPLRSLSAETSPDIFGAGGAIVETRDAEDAIRRLRTAPHLDIGPTLRRTIAGRQALGVTVDVAPDFKQVTSCGRACVAVLGVTGGTFYTDPTEDARLWFLDHGDSVVLFWEQAPPGGSFTITEHLLDSLRLAD